MLTIIYCTLAHALINWLVQDTMGFQLQSGTIVVFMSSHSEKMFVALSLNQFTYLVLLYVFFQLKQRSLLKNWFIIIKS